MRGTPQSEDTPAHTPAPPWAGLAAHKGRHKSNKIILDAVGTPSPLQGTGVPSCHVPGLLEPSVWEPRGTVSALHNVNQSPVVQVPKVSHHDPEMFNTRIPHRLTHPQAQCSLSLGVSGP